MNKKIINKKTIIIISVVLIIFSLVIYQKFLKKDGETFSLFEVRKGNILQEVSAIGQVEKGEKIDLGFKDSGRIENIYVTVGEEVEIGQKLMRLETTQLSIQLSEAQASLDLTQAELDKLLAGASAEEIQVAQTAVNNAQTSLNNAKQNLEDVQAQAEESLESAYQDALNTLNNSYLKIYNALNKVISLRENYFIGTDQTDIKVKDNENIISNIEEEIRTYLDSAKENPTSDNINIALSYTKSGLENVYEALEVIRDTCEIGVYKEAILDSDRTALDNHKGYINDALSNIIDAEQNISSTKLSNNSQINTAQASVSSTEGALKTAQDQLTLKIAGPRQEDVALYQAKVKQAQAKVSLLEDQIYQSSLRSPLKGEISSIEKEVGEQASVAEAVVVLIPQKPFQIEADISESDIGKLNLGNPVEIILDAFPETNFSGQVVKIEPAETIISGVVYYKIKATLDTEDNKIKPGMTANIAIITANKDNVLVIPTRAVKIKEGKKTVKRLINDHEFEEVEVETGLKGALGDIEIVSGLKEGDKIITYIND